MCQMSFQRRTAKLLSCGLLASLPLVAFYSPTHAQQVLDVEEQAQASRDRLAAAINAVDGSELRSSLLTSAEESMLTHWYSGEVNIDGQWLTLPEAEQHALGNKSLNGYRKLRQQVTDCLADHDRLARWCKKNDLPDQARVHWQHALRFDRSHRPALKELELTWHEGKLVAESKAARSRARKREWTKQKKSWHKKIQEIARNIDEGQPNEKLAAQKELQAINDPAAVPALLEIIAEPAQKQLVDKRQADIIEVLGNINSKSAIKALTKIASGSSATPARYAAINRLKSMPYEKYIPTMLAKLKMPIDLSVNIQKRGTMVVSNYSYSQEQPGGREKTKRSKSYRYVETRPSRPVKVFRRGDYVPEQTKKGFTYKTPINPGHGHGLVEYQVSGICSNGNPYTQIRRKRVYGEEHLKEVKVPGYTIPEHYEYERVGTAYVDNSAFAYSQQVEAAKSQQQASQEQAQLDKRNQRIVIRNQRIADVLTEVTGEALSANPKPWWNWWSEYLADHPDIATVGARKRLNTALLNQQARGLARGTWVWTLQGKQPVESVLPGDYVLAQHPRTGELAYKVVLAIASPREMAVSSVEVDDSELHCAAGHVVWATGSGWQRVSKLTTNQTLHGATTESAIGGVKEAFIIDGYDLIVDDFHTYFAGEAGLLVHDATPIAPAPNALPGFSPAAVANAAKLAVNMP